MRYPEFLKEQGTIGFIAPSFGCNIEPYRSAFENAKRKFTEMGYNLQEGPNCMEGCGVGISNTPQKCGQEINDYYVRKENDVLISCGGGELMCEDLNYVDFEALKSAPPKWFMGYSDNTNLTFLLTTICDTASVYGPCVSSFGMEKWHPSIQDAFDLLTGKLLNRPEKAEEQSGKAEESEKEEQPGRAEKTLGNICLTGYDAWEKESLKTEDNPYVSYNTTEPSVIKVYPYTAGKAEFAGRLIGGCMDCLVTMLGTKFDHAAEFAERYKEDGIIWFLESCELNVMSVRRALWQMENAGWFRYVNGFLIGRPMVYGEELMGLDQYQAVTGILGKYNVPIVMDADIGHLPPMMPLICGSYASVSAGENKFRLTMELR